MMPHLAEEVHVAPCTRRGPWWRNWRWPRGGSGADGGGDGDDRGAGDGQAAGHGRRGSGGGGSRSARRRRRPSRTSPGRWKAARSSSASMCRPDRQLRASPGRDDGAAPSAPAAWSLGLPALLALPGCGFHPLYASNGSEPGPAKEGLGQISVGLIPERAGQILRQELQARFDHGDAPAVKRTICGRLRDQLDSAGYPGGHHSDADPVHGSRDLDAGGPRCGPSHDHHRQRHVVDGLQHVRQAVFRPGHRDGDGLAAACRVARRPDHAQLAAYFDKHPAEGRRGAARDEARAAAGRGVSARSRPARVVLLLRRRCRADPRARGRGWCGRWRERRTIRSGSASWSGTRLAPFQRRWRALSMTGGRRVVRARDAGGMRAAGAAQAAWPGAAMRCCCSRRRAGGPVEAAHARRRAGRRGVHRLLSAEGRALEQTIREMLSALRE